MGVILAKKSSNDCKSGGVVESIIEMVPESSSANTELVIGMCATQRKETVIKQPANNNSCNKLVRIVEPETCSTRTELVMNNWMVAGQIEKVANPMSEVISGDERNDDFNIEVDPLKCQQSLKNIPPTPL